MRGALRLMKSMTRIIALLLVVSLLQGCLLTRLHQTQKQVCSNKTRLEMTQHGLAIVFDRPLLTRDDIISILASTSGGVSPDKPDLAYTAKNKNDGQYSFPVVFQFSRADEQYKLRKVDIGKRFQDFVPEELLHQIFDAGCTAKRKGLGIEVEISRVPPDRMPKLDDVRKLLGQPAHTKAAATAFLYDLNGAETAVITVSYDDEMTRMTSAGILFQKYSLIFDFKKGIATARLKNFSDAIRLGFRP